MQKLPGTAADFIAASDLAIAVELPIEVVVEATGQPIAAARHALIAIEAGKHLALVTKELDSVVGPELKAMAEERGRIVTTVDGDQPSLLIGLATWAEVMGFHIVAAGKSSEYDFVFDPRTATSTSNERSRGRCRPRPSLGSGRARQATRSSLHAHAAIANFPQRAVPDLCELMVVANATGLQPDVWTSTHPCAHQRGADDLLPPGGWRHPRRRPASRHVPCLRKPDEISFAGGVFVVVRCDDPKSWDMLAQKGHIVSRTGANATVFLPRHLLGLEAATSILDAAIHRVSGYGSDYRPRYDLIAVAIEDLPAGTVLSMGGHHHTISGVTAEFRPAEALVADAPAPFYLAADCRLAKAVRKGEEIRMIDLELPETSRPSGAFAAGRMRASSDNKNDTDQPECLNDGVPLIPAARPLHGRPRGELPLSRRFCPPERRHPVLKVIIAGSIALLFFLQGARLSRKAIIDGAIHWRLHLMVFAATFVIFPMLGLLFSFSLGVHARARHWPGSSLPLPSALDDTVLHHLHFHCERKRGCGRV